MPGHHLFTHCAEAVCVAEDAAVSFYGTKTLKKFRVEHFNGARLCGIFLESAGHHSRPTPHNLLHVIDVEANWFTVSLSTMELIQSATIAFAPHAGIASRAREAVCFDGGADVEDKSSTARATLIQEAHFHLTGGHLMCVLLTSQGVVYEAQLRCATDLDTGSFSSSKLRARAGSSSTAARTAHPILTLPYSSDGRVEGVMAVGRETGLVVCAVRGRRVLRYTGWSERAAHWHGGERTSPNSTAGFTQGGVARPHSNATTSASTATSKGQHHHGSSKPSDSREQPSQRLLSVDVVSLACSPTSESVAVGGGRGELLLYPRMHDTHHFADHWHHTPLHALAFAPDGRSLFSGAEESTLLVWSVSSSFTYRKIAIPASASASASAVGAVTSQESEQRIGDGDTLYRTGIHGIVPSATTPTTLLLTCGAASMVVVDVLQMRVTQRAEGLQWSCGAACRALQVERWMGHEAVVLTGLPGVVRIGDPYTQQAIYSLHVSLPTETIPYAPRHGITFAGLLDEGRLIWTYAWFAGTVLAAQMRLWSYDWKAKRHRPGQIIYAPHASEVWAMVVDKAHRRVFTAAEDGIKCWAPVVLPASLNRMGNNPNTAQEAAVWRHVSGTLCPSPTTRCMALDGPGNRCFVADDCVYVYDVSDCQPGMRWPVLYTLTQSVHTQPMQQLLLLPPSSSSRTDDNDGGREVLVARDTATADPLDSEAIFFWVLPSSSATSAAQGTADAPRARTAPHDDTRVARCVGCGEARVYRPACAPTGERCLGEDGQDMRVMAMCVWSGEAVLLATTRAGVMLTLSAQSSSLGRVCGWAAVPNARTAHRVRHMHCVGGTVEQDGSEPRGAATAGALTGNGGDRDGVASPRAAGEYRHVAVVDDVSGLRVWRVAVQCGALVAGLDSTRVATAGAAAVGVVGEDVTVPRGAGADWRDALETPRVADYFGSARSSALRTTNTPRRQAASAQRRDGEEASGRDSVATESASDGEGNDDAADEEFGTVGGGGSRDGAESAAAAQRVRHATRIAETGRWLDGVLNEPAYAAPSISSVLALYLQQRCAASSLTSGH